MILRGIHVENWRNIAQLELANLPEGIVVLYGPNRTGKSSLVLALRSCLFDADHDSAGKELKNSVSWNGAGPPKIVVEFCTGGATYRLTKVFSKKKDGVACLEQQTGSGWKTVEDAPKEAARRARELLSADKSSAGLNQLLWLTQGEVGLPERKNIDNTLAAKLVDVLGVMMTARDFHFKQGLDGRCAKWFTPLGRQKEGSPVGRWEKLLQERLERRQEEQKQLSRWEDALARMQIYEEELPGRKRDAEQSMHEVEGLKQEQERGKERWRRYGDAQKELKAAAAMRTQAEEKLTNLREAQQRRREEQGKLGLAKDAMHAAQERWHGAELAHAEQLRLLENCRQAEEQHRQGRDEIDDRRKLLSLALQHAQLERQRDAVALHEKEIAEVEAYLGTAIAPDENQLTTLRDNRRQAAALRAQLKAEELTLTITLHRPTPMTVALDGQAATVVDASTGEARGWHLRQRADITIPEVGHIELARTKEKLDLDRMARDLADKDRDYQESVEAFGENSTDETCLDRLAEKRLQRNAHAQRLQQIRNELAKLAPDGRSSLQLQTDAVANQMQIVLQRRPALATWLPAAPDIDVLEKQFKDRSTELESRRKLQDAAKKVAADHLHQMSTDLQILKQTLAGAVVAEASAQNELQRLGNETALREQLAQAQKAQEAAEKSVAEHQLTEAEQTIDRRLAEAETALKERTRRRDELDKRMSELRGELRSAEGLHTRLADAEAGVQEVETALAREQLDAGAHKHLRELFEGSRENQVQAVMGPIAGRVLDWAHKIGLHDYREVRFGDGFMPEGVVMAGGAPEQPPLMIDNDSYGTGEQLSILVRLALGGALAKDEPVVAIFDDPLAHTDPIKHRNMLDVLRIAAEGGTTWLPPAGRLQILIFTCHPERFDHLPGATHIDLAAAIKHPE